MKTPAKKSRVRHTKLSCATVILVDGKIWTGNAKQSETEALAMSGNRILSVGGSKEILKLRDSKTKVIDLRGRRAVPGFNDAHLHFYMGGASLAQIQLRQSKSAAELREALAAFARALPENEWILGGNWDHQNWTPAVLPTRELIDGITPHHPVFINRFEGHMTLANSLAMKLAGVGDDVTDVPGGEIVRDTRGRPTGIFKDAARNFIERIIPFPSDEKILSAILTAQEHAALYGVTSVQDMGVLGLHRARGMRRVICAYQLLEKRKQLRIRMSVHLPLPEFAEFSDVAGYCSERLQIHAIKSFADGALGSSTAWFCEPYSDDPASCGIPSDELADPERMYSLLEGADRAGLQLAVHAIGDRANRTVLSLYEKLRRRDRKRNGRLRIEHAQHLQPQDIARFSKLGVTASMQPYHCIDDGRWALQRIGERRAKTTYAFRSLLDTGVTLAFGSDWFVAPLNPLEGIYAAVTRRPLDGSQPDGWVPEQKISVAEAVRAYTLGSAFASKTEHIKGSLESGKLADIAVLSDDIFKIDPREIRNAKVDMTIFDGEVIYERA